MALRGLKVLEMSGLAPSPFCGMVLQDFGADVIRVDKIKTGGHTLDRLARSKQSIAVNVKKSAGVKILQNLAKISDVLIEPYRKGVMERLSLGPNDLMGINPKLIYARLSGYGHDGPMADKAGHDINYIALSGILSHFGEADKPPSFPINLLADFAGGGLMCAFGICAALIERHKSGLGQVVDAAMVDGSAYLGTWLWRSQDMFAWGHKRGHNVLDGGSAFYNTYKTKDDKFIAVGALEPQFYSELLKGLGVDQEEFPQIEMIGKNAIDRFASIFIQKTQSEWIDTFKDLDACFTPILDREEAARHELNVERNNFKKSSGDSDYFEPNPAPKLSRTPASCVPDAPNIGQHTRRILIGLNYTDEEIRKLIDEDVVECNDDM
ncbi:AMACR (predicted) [Pycnogonum litorale]